jgi:hypothetical protein
MWTRRQQVVEYIGAHYAEFALLAGALFMIVLGFFSIQDGLTRPRG